MKQAIVILFVNLMVSISCSKKALPVISTRTSDPLPPVLPADNVAPDLQRGKMIYTNRCSRCHVLPDLNKYDPARWETILKLMIPGAKLDRVQEVHVKAYILANAAK